MSNIDQVTVLVKMEKFLKNINETFPEWMHTGTQKLYGTCDGFSFMMMRASLIGEEQQFFNRLQWIAAASDQTITKMAKLFLHYRKVYAETVATEKQVLLYLIKISLYKSNHKMIRDRHHKMISQKTLMRLNLSNFEMELLEKANDLYVFISSLLIAQDPGEYIKNNYSGAYIVQGSWKYLFEFLAPDVAINSIDCSIKTTITESLAFSFVFLGNEVKEYFWKILRKNDYVRICSFDHTIFLKVCYEAKNKPSYFLYDPNEERIPKRVQSFNKLIEMIDISFDNGEKRSTSQTLIETHIFTSSQSNQICKRPTSYALVTEILSSRKKNNIMDVDAKSDEKSTSLMVLSKVGSVAAVTLLLKKGANINATNLSNSNPILEAMWNNHVGVVKELLTHDDIILKSSYLFLAVEQNYAEILKLLIPAFKARGLSINPIRNKISLFETAIKSFNYEARDVLLNYSNLEEKMGPNENTALMYAIRAGDKNLFDTLLARGAHVNYKNENDHSPLYFATFYQRSEMVKALLSHGANPSLGKTSIPKNASQTEKKQPCSFMRALGLSRLG